MSAFWNLEQDEGSSQLTTFITPYGRYFMYGDIYCTGNIHILYKAKYGMLVCLE